MTPNLRGLHLLLIPLVRGISPQVMVLTVTMRVEVMKQVSTHDIIVYISYVCEPSFVGV